MAAYKVGDIIDNGLDLDLDPWDLSTRPHVYSGADVIRICLFRKSG